MSYDKRTDWFPTAIAPVRAGWYEARRSTVSGELYLFWNGSAWEYHGAKHAASDPKFGELTGDAWRGLAAEPIAVGRAKLDVAGERYGRLVAKRRAFVNQQGAHWSFACDCGSNRVARLKDVRAGNTASCGCLQFKKGALSVKRPWRKSQDPDFIRASA